MELAGEVLQLQTEPSAPGIPCPGGGAPAVAHWHREPQLRSLRHAKETAPDSHSARGAHHKATQPQRAAPRWLRLCHHHLSHVDSGTGALLHYARPPLPQPRAPYLTHPLWPQHLPNPCTAHLCRFQAPPSVAVHHQLAPLRLVHRLSAHAACLHGIHHPLNHCRGAPDCLPTTPEPHPANHCHRHCCRRPPIHCRSYLHLPPRLLPPAANLHPAASRQHRQRQPLSAP